MSGRQRIVNIADLPLRDGGNGKGFQAKLGRPDGCWGSTASVHLASGFGRSIAIT